MHEIIKKLHSKIFVASHSIWFKALFFLILLFVAFYIMLYEYHKNGIIKTQDGRRMKVKLEIASSYADQSKGLSKRNKICNNCGMLFIYKKPTKLSFWMKDTSVPLDIAFLDTDMRIQEIVRNMEPFSNEIVKSSLLSRFALEMNAGYFDSKNIKVGDRLMIDIKLYERGM